jgi:hypothetical protein
MPPGVEQFVGLLDFAKIGYKNLDTGALRFVFDFLQVGGGRPILLLLDCFCPVWILVLDSGVVLNFSLLLNKSCARTETVGRVGRHQFWTFAVLCF